MTKRDRSKRNDQPSKGVCANQSTPESDISNSDSDSVWKSASKLKQEVQTIIDIMGPSMSPKFNYNTSSEADNEESVFTNSKFSLIKFKERCTCNDDSEKTDAPDIQSKNENEEEQEDTTVSGDLNATSNSATVDENTDSKNNFEYEENVTQYICPPPLIPANIGFSSECFCPQVASLLHGGGLLSSPYHQGNFAANLEQDRITKDGAKCKETALGKQLNHLVSWLRNKVPSSQKNIESTPCCEYYKMNVKRNRGDDKSPPRRVVFELVKGIPSKEEPYLPHCPLNSYSPTKEKKNTANEKIQVRTEEEKGPEFANDFNCQMVCPKLKRPIEKTTYCDDNQKTRVDVYYFDHGCFSHYRTTDAMPMLHSEEVALKTEKHTTKFWAEIFGVIHIGFSFVTSFVLQFFRFILYSICRPLTIGILQLASDYFFKPFLATIFNGIIQPVLIFCFNIATSFRDLCDPIAEGVGFFLRECAILLRAIRLVEVNNESCKGWTESKCEGKRTTKKDKTVC